MPLSQLAHSRWSSALSSSSSAPEEPGGARSLRCMPSRTGGRGPSSHSWSPAECTGLRRAWSASAASSCPPRWPRAAAAAAAGSCLAWSVAPWSRAGAPFPSLPEHSGTWPAKRHHTHTSSYSDVYAHNVHVHVHVYVQYLHVRHVTAVTPVKLTTDTVWPSTCTVGHTLICMYSTVQ